MEIEIIRKKVEEALEIKTNGSKKYGHILYNIIKSLKDTGISFTTITAKINKVIQDEENKYKEDSIKKIYYWYSNKNSLAKKAENEKTKTTENNIEHFKDKEFERSDILSLIEDNNEKYERQNRDLFKSWGKLEK